MKLLLKIIPRNKKSSRSEFQISKNDSGRPKLSFLDQIVTSQSDKNQKFEMISKSKFVHFGLIPRWDKFSSGFQGLF